MLKYHLKNVNLCIGILLLLGLCFRFIGLVPYPVDPDESEYYNIAKHFAWGDGYQMSIKWNFFRPLPAIHAGIGERFPLFPLITAIPFYFLSSFAACKILNILIGLICCALFYFLVKKIIPAHWACCTATLLLFLNPILIDTSKSLLSEPLFLMIILGNLLVIYTFTYQEVSFLYGTIAGVLFGLSYLTRPDGMVYFVLTVLWSFFFNRKKQALFMVIGFLILTLPYFIHNTQVNGTPFYSSQNYNFSLRSYGEGMNDPFRTDYPSALSFLAGNWKWAVVQVLYRVAKNIDALLSRYFLSWLAAFAVFSIVCDKSEKKFVILLFLLAVSSFILPALAFAAVYRPGYLLVSYVLITILCFKGLWRIINGNFKSYLAYFFIIPIFIFYILVNTNHLIKPQTKTLKSMGDSNFKHICQEVKRRTKSTDVISTEDPWTLNFLTDRPAILLPYTMNIIQLKAYAHLYSPNFILTTLPVDNDALVPAYETVAWIPEATSWKLFKKMGIEQSVTSGPIVIKNGPVI